MRQLVLLGLDPVIHEDGDAVEVGEAADPGPADRVATPEVDERQGELFEDRAILLRDLDHALGRGAFEEALRAWRALESVYGPPPEGPPGASLELLAGTPWERVDASLDAWASVEATLRPGPRRRIRAGVFVRLLELHTPDDLVRVRPSSLPRLSAFLEADPGRPEGEGRREARRLVRDALLAGRALEPLEFRHDEAVGLVLAEEMAPAWLACLGAVRRLWPVPPLPAGEVDPLLPSRPDAPPIVDPALAFWHCLRVAETPACPVEALHEARRRMKALQPELHATLMRRVSPRPGG